MEDKEPVGFAKVKEDIHVAYLTALAKAHIAGQKYAQSHLNISKDAACDYAMTITEKLAP